MKGIRIPRALVALSLLLVPVRAGDEGRTVAPDPDESGPKVKKALNKAFRGRVVKIKGKKVTLYYDFEDPAQLDDFQAARPPRLLDAGQNRVHIQGGRLVLEGSSSIRHKMEGSGEMRARFTVRVGQQSNVGTVFTEPVLSDFYVVCNLFDDRFYEDGGLIVAACGLHEDEGADSDMSLVNWRDIYRTSLKNKVLPGQPVEMEVAKDGTEEYVRVGNTEGKGSSRGKGGEFPTYQFGFFVHKSRATFDDLTLTVELTDEFLDLNDLRAAVEVDWEDTIPTSGPLAGISGVPPTVREAIESFAAGGGLEGQVLEAMGNTNLPEKARVVAAGLLEERGNPRVVPLLIDGLYSADKRTRELSIGVIKALTGKNFGYSAGAGEKARSAAIRKLNEHIAENRDRYYG